MEGNSPNAEIQDPVQREQRARYNAQQQSQAMADARRLAQLARELQDELEHADGLTLPAGTFRKADEIIKLAKSVKGKMQPH
jgi:peptide deformylase